MTTFEVPNIGINAQPIIAEIDNGGTNTRILIREGDIEMESIEYSTPRDYKYAIEYVGETAIALCRGKKLDAIGFAVAGKIEKGKIADAGELKDYGWCGKPFKEDAAQAFSINTDRVAVLNDCVAAAKAQQVVNRRTNDTANTGYVATISTGFGGAGFIVDSNELIPDEPGHEFLKEGALCGCKKEGCAEAHISGSGIERKFGVPAEDLPLYTWAKEVIPDTVETHVQLLQRLEKNGFVPEELYYFGSVATKRPYLVLPGIRAGLKRNEDRLLRIPTITLAEHGDRGGLVGAGDAALELIAD